MKYSNIDKLKTAFLFELDNVLYPEKDYLFQVYYLFAALLEYVEQIDAKEATDLMVSAYLEKGKDAVFDTVKEKYQLKEAYRANFNHLLVTANVPLKLLLYKNMLDLLQQIVVDRKKLFIVTNGDPAQQLHKIKHMEWHGLEKYLVCYFANEIKPKPETDVIDMLLNDHNLKRRDVLVIGNSDVDELCAQASGIDYVNAEQFL